MEARNRPGAVRREKGIYMKYYIRFDNPIFPGKEWKKIPYEQALQDVRDVVKDDETARAMLARENAIKCRHAKILVVSGQ